MWDVYYNVGRSSTVDKASAFSAKGPGSKPGGSNNL